MKHISTILILSFLIACAAPTEETWPTDLAGKQKLLTERKSSLKSLQSDIDKLEKELATLMPEKVERKISVNVVPLERKTFESYVKIQGSVMTDEVVMASSETGGRILSMTVNEGDYVQSGQMIASVDLVTLEKQMDELRTRYDLAKVVFEKQERLWNQNIGSEMQFLQAKSNKESIEKSMQTLQSQLGKQGVTAPISGYVDRVFLKQGEMASPGLPIVQILNTSSVKIVADVPENYLGSIRRGDYVNVHFPALEKDMKKKISMIGRSIDPSNRTFKIELNTSNPGGVLKPNLLAELDIVDQSLKDQVVIPLDVIQQEVTGKRYVFVTDESNNEVLRARKAYIKSGSSYENDIVIEEGLDGTEKLIVNGISDLSNNSAITIEEPVANE